MKKLTFKILLGFILFMGAPVCAEPFVLNLPWTPDSTSLQAVLYNALNQYDFLLLNEAASLVEVNAENGTIVLSDGTSRIECQQLSTGPKSSMQYRVYLNLDLDSLGKAKRGVTISSLLFHALEQQLDTEYEGTVLTREGAKGETILLRSPDFSASLNLKGKKVTLTPLPTLLDQMTTPGIPVDFNNQVGFVLLNEEVRTEMFRAFEEAGLKSPVLDSVTQKSLGGPNSSVLSFLFRENIMTMDTNLVSMDVEIERSPHGGDLKVVAVEEPEITLGMNALGQVQPEGDLRLDSDIATILLSKEFERAFKKTARRYGDVQGQRQSLRFYSIEKFNPSAADHAKDVTAVYRIRIGRQGGVRTPTSIQLDVKINALDATYPTGIVEVQGSIHDSSASSSPTSPSLAKACEVSNRRISQIMDRKGVNTKLLNSDFVDFLFDDVRIKSGDLVTTDLRAFERLLADQLDARLALNKLEELAVDRDSPAFKTLVEKMSTLSANPFGKQLPNLVRTLLREGLREVK